MVASATNFADATMTETEVDYLPLRVTRVRANGKREFAPESKRRLIEACSVPGVSISGMALKAGVNANQLHKWIREHERAGAAVMDNVEPAPSAFVPVVAIGDVVVPAAAAPESVPVVRREAAAPSARPAAPARLTAQFPNGVRVELECCGRDVGLVRAMIEALGAS